MKRILMFGLVLALLGAMIISSAAFANGATNQYGATSQNGPAYGPGGGYGPGDCTTCVPKCLDVNDDDICGRPQ
jgi:hypothetical protein